MYVSCSFAVSGVVFPIRYLTVNDLLSTFCYVPHKKRGGGDRGKERKKSFFWSQAKAEFFCYVVVTDYFSNMLIFPSAIAFHD